ncbi:MAG: bifunctional diguanylate cyclase/phosphodiesterase [Pseudomonadota bacterium]
MRRFRTVFVLTAAVLVVLVIAMTVTLANYLMWNSQSTRFNSTLEIGQLSAELFRFEVAVSDRFLQESVTSQAEVDLRYQILLNRLSVIDSSETFTALAYVPGGAEEYASIGAAIARVGPQLPSLADPVVARRVMNELLPLNGRMLRLASSIQNVLTDRIAQNQGNLGHVVGVVSVMVVVLLLIGLALIGFVLRLSRRSDHDARHDALTGVLNRHGFNAALANRQAVGACAIVLLDVDHFKDINDRLGHDTGDRFLVQFAARTATSVQGAQLFARLGGDEFAIVFFGKDVERRAQSCCDAIAQALAVPFDVGDIRLNAGASMGIAVKNCDDLGDPAALLKGADIALYAAKAAGRACYRTFDPVMRDLALREQSLRRGLTGALRRAEFTLRFQPIVEISDGRTVGFEALLRWMHADLGQVSPVEFIPVAESSEQIISIGRWVIEEALCVAADWPDDVFISINLSARQFTDATLGEFVERSIVRFGIAPQRIVFEITESVLVRNDAALIIAGLRRLGVQIALDDFGTGFASLSYLRRFEFDKIKIDQSFIRAESGDSRNAVIVRAICDLANELELEVIAEGVETVAQLAFSKSVGCRYAQGFLFSRPLLAAYCPGRWQAAAAVPRLRSP